MIAGIISIEDHTIQFDHNHDTGEFIIHVQDNMTGISKRVSVNRQHFAMTLALALGVVFESSDLNTVLYSCAEPVMKQLAEPELRFIP